MKKICFSTLGSIEYSLEKFVELAKAHDIDTLEIRGLDGELDATKMECFLPENAEATKKYLKQNGIKLLVLGSSASCDLLYGDNEAIQNVYREIDVAHRMDIKFLRIFGNSIKEEYDVVCNHVVSVLTELCNYAKDKNVTILMETHGDFFTKETVLPVAEKMEDYDNFGILWDVAHPDKKYGNNWVEFYDAIKPFLNHMHIKDHIRNPHKLTDIGKGDIPFVDICNYLESDGYDGYFSLEWEKKWNPYLGNIESALADFVKALK